MFVTGRAAAVASGDMHVQLTSQDRQLHITIGILIMGSCPFSIGSFVSRDY